jgi:hypothetical protein
VTLLVALLRYESEGRIVFDERDRSAFWRWDRWTHVDEGTMEWDAEDGGDALLSFDEFESFEAAWIDIATLTPDLAADVWTLADDTASAIVPAALPLAAIATRAAVAQGIPRYLSAYVCAGGLELLELLGARAREGTRLSPEELEAHLRDSRHSERR